MALFFTESWDAYPDNGTTFTGGGNNAVARGKYKTFSTGVWVYDAIIAPRHGLRPGGASSTGAQQMVVTVPSADEHATMVFSSAYAFRRNGSNINQQIPLVTFSSDDGATDHLTLSIFTGALGGADSHLRIENGLLNSGVNVQTVLTGCFATAAAGGKFITDFAWRVLDFKCVLGDSGSIEVRLGQQVIYTGSRDTKNGGTKTVLDTLKFYLWTDGSNNDFWMDDTYALTGSGSTCNDYLGDVVVQYRAPNNTGSNNVWTNSSAVTQTLNYQFADAYDSADLADYVTTSTDDQIDSYAFTDSSYASPNTLLAVAHYVRAAKDDTGPRSIAHYAKSGASTVVGSDLALALSATHYCKFWHTAPDGAAWDFTKFNAAEFGFKSRP